MNEKWDEIQGKLDLVRVSREFELSEFEIFGFYSTNKCKKPVKLIVQKSFAVIKAEGSVIFQNIFSSMADSCDVVSVLPCSPTDKGK